MKKFQKKNPLFERCERENRRYESIMADASDGDLLFVIWFCDLFAEDEEPVNIEDVSYDIGLYARIQEKT